MAQLTPPSPPVYVGTADDDRLRRLHFRLWQLMATIVTVFATVWIILFGIPILTITALAVAKHVLVAIYAMGLDIYPMRPTKR